MMKTISRSNKFKKDYKKVKQYKAFDEKTFMEVVEKLANKQPLPAKYKMHKMAAKGVKYQGYFNIHICPNILLMCNITEDELELYRIGSHSDLGVTESYEKGQTEI